MFACRRVAHIALPVLLIIGALAPLPAVADEWVEPKFDPPVGSKWTIARELNVEKITGGNMVGHTLKETALLTIDEKTADGFIVSYTRQNSSYHGDPAGAASQRLTFEAQQGLVTRVVTDRSGKPLRILNYDEVKAVVKKALDAQPAVSANPVVLDAMHHFAARIMQIDDKRAAELYLDELPTLAVAQNTGLKPGEMRKSTLPVASPLTDSVTKTQTLSIAKADPATGKVRYLMTETYDAASIKALVAETVRQFALTNANSVKVDAAIKNATVASVSRAQLDVAGGMTREMRRQSVMSMRFPGTQVVTTEDELVTVAPWTDTPVADAPVSVAPVASAPLKVAPVATPVSAPAVPKAVTK